MNGYYTTLSSLDSRDLAMQATVSNVANIGANQYFAEHSKTQSGPFAYNVKVSKAELSSDAPRAVTVSATDSIVAAERSNLFYFDDSKKVEFAYGEVSRESEQLATYASVVKERTVIEENLDNEVRNIVASIQNEAGFKANTAAIRTLEETTGMLFSISI